MKNMQYDKGFCWTRNHENTLIFMFRTLGGAVALYTVADDESGTNQNIASFPKKIFYSSYYKLD